MKPQTTSEKKLTTGSKAGLEPRELMTLKNSLKTLDIVLRSYNTEGSATLNAAAMRRTDIEHLKLVLETVSKNLEDV